MDQFMEAALEEARTGAAEGGIPIGAALVDGEDRLVATGRNRRALESPINAMMANVVSIGATQTSGATLTSLATVGSSGGLTRWTRPPPRQLLWPRVRKMLHNSPPLA